MWSWCTNVTDRRTDGQTDDMHSQYRALHYSVSRGVDYSTLPFCVQRPIKAYKSHYTSRFIYVQIRPKQPSLSVSAQTFAGSRLTLAKSSSLLHLLHVYKDYTEESNKAIKIHIRPIKAVSSPKICTIEFRHFATILSSFARLFKLQ